MKLKLYFLIIIKLTIVLAIEVVNKNDNNILNCVAKIYHKDPEISTFMISKIDNNILDFRSLENNNGVALFTNDELKTTKKLLKSQIIILLINRIKQFKTLIQNLSNLDVWNSRAKFIVGYFGNTKNIGEIFNTSWNFWIYNINVVMENNSETNIYTYFPFSEQICGDYYDYKLLGSCDENNFEVFPNKIPLDMHGCEIKAMAYVIPPYVINLKMPREESGKTGIEVTIIHNVAKRMNVSINFLKNPHTHWGYRYPNGSFSMMYQALKTRETDIIFGFTYRNQSYNIDFDSSFCHLGDASIWFFPTAPQMAQWKHLTLIFEPNLWLAILFMLLVNGIAWWIVGKTREPFDDFNDITICIMSSMYVLLQGSVQGPKTWKLRLMFIIWLITCLLIFTAHQCQLISILTATLYERQMKTLEELVASGNKFGFYPTVEDAYREKSPINNAILNRYEQCPLTAECLNRTAFKRDFAVVKNRRQVLYLMPRYYTFSNGRAMLFDTGIASFTTKETYYVNKGFPLLERINRILMLLASNGLITKWDADTRFFVLKIESDGQQEPLTLRHLQGAFFVLTIGITFAFVTLIVELIVRKCCKPATKKITRYTH